MIELERTFLAKSIPKGLKNCKNKEILDIFIPKTVVHPRLRIRKNNDKYEITKKVTVTKDDFSKYHEHNTPLTKEEFEILSEIDGKRLHKIRYLLEYKGLIAEIDVFLDDLKGLVVIEFEFESEEQKDKFIMPDFCLVDVTQEEFIAGGMLAGKSYDDIEEHLDKFGYKKLEVE